MSVFVRRRFTRAQSLLLPQLLLGFTLSLIFIAPSSSKGASQLSEASSVQVAAGVTGLTARAGQSANQISDQQVEDWMTNLSFGFTPNQGQVANVSGKAAANVILTANDDRAHVYVTTSGMTHYFLKKISKGERKWVPKRTGIFTEKEFERCRLDVDLLGASISPDRMLLEEPLADFGVTNFYHAHCPDGVLDVPTYGKITFTDVYPGIDWIVLSRPGQAVQHDFIVHPGADPSRIRMEYKGAVAIEVLNDARLLKIRTRLGEVQEGDLDCFQNDRSSAIGGKFQVEGNTVRFVIDEYDRTRPLTIDPPLIWSTYYGGSEYDGPRSIVCDNVNNYVYVVGYTASTNLPVQDDSASISYYQDTLSAAPGQDAFIWKFTQAGVRLWATYYGGNDFETHSDAVVDLFGNLYVCGTTNSSNWPTQILPGAYNQVTGSSPDAVLIKFNSLGVRQWATRFGGGNFESGHGITSDATGAIYMVGNAYSTDMPLANPGGGAYFQNTLGPAVDAFITKFSPTGVLQWSTYFGGDNWDEGLGVEVSLNNLYVAGSTESTDMPTANPGGGAYFQGTSGGLQDGYIARFNLAGVLNWSTYYGGSFADVADDPVADGSGNVFVNGYSASSDFPTFNPGGTTYFQGVLGGSMDFTIAKFNNANARLWATYFGGTGIDYLNGSNSKSMALDSRGRLYMTGMVISTDLPVVNPGGGAYYQPSSAGGPQDALIAQFANDGTLLWSTYYGANVTDFGTSVAIGNAGCLFATGESWDVGNLPTQNPGGGAYFQGVSAGSDDGYIAKFCHPLGACCIDLNCLPAASAAICSTMGGTAYYPNQTCDNTVCSIHCTICGTKYNDRNKNGTQDPGEPGIPGWTIQLYYWNGPLFASTITDSLGNYCFNDIPCGAWTVNEQLQQGWVQTDPSPNVHNVSIGTGTTLNDIDFGNTTCVQDTCCVKPALGMIAWYPFDEDGPDFSHDIAAKTRNGWQYLDQSSATAGKVGKAYDFDSARYIRVFDDPFAQVDTGDFTIDAWIEPRAFTTDCEDYPYHPCAAMPIVDNRRWVEGASGDNGIMFYVKPISATHGRLGLVMNIFPNPPDSFETATAPIVLDDWQHVAVTVARNGGTMVGTFYYNGSPVGIFMPRIGSIFSTTAPGPMMDIGHGPYLSSYGAGQNCRPREKYFTGPIDEVEIFGRALSGAEVQDIYLSGSRGKCKISCAIPASVVLCRTATTVTMNLTVCNQSPFTSVANFSFAPLASGSGCNFDATAVTFSPASGTITLLPGQCTQIPVTLTRPVGFTPGNIACFCVTVRDTLTGAMSTCCSKLLASNGWCVTVKDPRDITHLNTGQARAFNFTVKNETDAPATFDYSLRSEGGDHVSTPTSLALNGLPPGTPVIGSLTLPPWGEGDIVGDAILMSYRPMDLESILLEFDIDGDGLSEALEPVLIQPSSFPDCNQNGVDDSLDLLNGTSVDVNSNGFPDDCEGAPSDPSQCYVCGDADASSQVTISDAVYLINYIFSGGPAPNPTLSGDANCDSVITISDAVYLVNYIFSGGAPPCAACP